MAETVRYNVILNDEVSARLAAIEAKFASLEAKINGSNKAMAGMSKGLKMSNMMQGANLAFQLGQQVWGMAEAHVQAAGDIQSSTNALQVASKTDAEFGKNQQLINSLMDQAPISFSKSTQGLKMWTAATATSSIRGDVARQTFEDVALSAASMGLSAETQEGVFLAMSQMMSKGTVQAEELRGQLGERLPGAFALMAKSMGVTEQKLGKMMEQGQVMSAQVLPKFAALLRSEFAGGLDKANTSINGTLVRMDNLKEKFLVEITPAINTALLKVLEFSTWLSNLNWEPIADGLKPIITAIELMDNAFGRLFGTVGEGNKMMEVFATVFHVAMTPIYFMIGAINQLVEGVVGLAEAMNKLQSGDFSGAKNSLGNMLTRMEEIQAKSNEMITGGFKDIWDNRGKRNEDNLSWMKDPWAFAESAKGSAPTLSTAGKDSELKKANANISGSAPRTTNITIGNIIGQNTNMIKRESEAQDITTFSKMLLQALQQEIVNVNLI